MKPAKMEKVSITGPENRLKSVIDALYDLGLLHMESYSGELDTGRPFEEGEELSQILVDVRSLLSKLPEVETREPDEIELGGLKESIGEFQERLEDIEHRREQAESRLSDLEKQEEFYSRLKGTGLTAEDLEGTENLESFVGVFDADEFREEAGTDMLEVFEGSDASVIIYYREQEDEVEEALQRIDHRQLEVVETEFEGGMEAVHGKIVERRERVREEKQELEDSLEELAREWRGRLEKAEEFLTEKVEKMESPINFATTDSAFIARGWVPESRFEEMERELIDVTDGSVYIQREDGGQPPVKHDNPRPVKPFESLTDLVSVPRYNEIDPSLIIFLSFPLMFGFMIGDAGYGLSSLLVFYAGYRMFEGASDIFKSLMYASVATIFFGLLFGDAFGFVIFGDHSELAAATGIHFFESIPILFHRAEHLGRVFEIAALVGLVHINGGYLLGAYNEAVQHGFRSALLEKGSWIALEAAAALWFFYGALLGAPAAAAAVAMLYLGEGIEGIVEIPSLLSNVLSYLRIFGVSVAAVSLAAVVNSMASPLFEMGFIGVVAGTFVLILGHTFNTFIKIMEGFLQGIRLHYVELFSKFFEGGGTRYSPFGRLNSTT